jgi:KUP system potassium uptake protein
MSVSIDKKLSAEGVLVTLGIIFGDIGTSPLYVMKSIVGTDTVTEDLIVGGLSCIVWTLTLQTTFKYVILTLEADNKGEGGIFSLYSLVRRYRKWLYLPAMIGAGTLLADGIITPPISVSSAIEGLRIINPTITVIPIVLTILTLLFAFQRFGTKVVGSSFGPIMIVWFAMLLATGVYHILYMPSILKALNPTYALHFLTKHPHGFWILGAVFLATTGAEALYSDLGHCGRKNIRVAWIFVKAALLANYFGQGAWLLNRQDKYLGDINPFYAVLPQWFLIPGIIIATAATIIASQALISGSFTLISEAVSLDFWPKVKIKFPTDIKGQLYISSVNWILYAGCVATVLYFKESSHMEAAYGFSITIAMLMTTLLMSYFLLRVKKFPLWIVVLILLLFVTVETSFFIANLAKIKQRWMFLIFEFGIIFTMYTWFNARKMLKRFIKLVSIKNYIPTLKDLSIDKSISKFSTHLIYLSKAENPYEIEERILNSILNRNPKRADVYWFIHINRTDEPYTLEYTVHQVVYDKVIHVNFDIGFRIQPRVNIFFRKVIGDMVSNKELDITSRYDSLSKYKLPADFKFVILDRFLSIENELSFKNRFLLASYFRLRKWAQPDIKTFGLDTSDVIVEKIPLIITPAHNIKLIRKQSI